MGQLISGRYRLEHRIASGGMAEVWRAADEERCSGRHVVVKILDPHLASDDAFVARFRSEAIAAARHHPAIVAIYDTSHEDGAEAIVMGRRGHDPRRARRPCGPRPTRGGAHRRRRSPTPSPPVPGRARGPRHQAGEHPPVAGHAVVADFGIARAITASTSGGRTQVGMAVGSPAYMSPEQAFGGEGVDGRTDVFALGVVLFEYACAPARRSPVTAGHRTGEVAGTCRPALAVASHHPAATLHQAIRERRCSTWRGSSPRRPSCGQPC